MGATDPGKIMRGQTIGLGFSQSFGGAPPFGDAIQKHVFQSVIVQKQKNHCLLNSGFSWFSLGWLMGLEPTTTGITILDSTD